MITVNNGRRAPHFDRAIAGSLIVLAALSRPPSQPSPPGSRRPDAARVEAHPAGEAPVDDSPVDDGTSEGATPQGAGGAEGAPV